MKDRTQYFRFRPFSCRRCSRHSKRPRCKHLLPLQAFFLLFFWDPLMIPIPPERKPCTRLSRFFRPSRNFHTLAPKTPARRRLTAGLGHRRHSSPLFLLPTAGPPQTTRPPDGVCAFFLLFFFKTTRQTKHKAAPAAAGPMQIRLNSSRLTSLLPSRRLLRPLPVRPNRPTGVVPPSPPEETRVRGQRSARSSSGLVVQEDRAASRDSA